MADIDIIPSDDWPEDRKRLAAEIQRRQEELARDIKIILQGRQQGKQSIQPLGSGTYHFSTEGVYFNPSDGSGWHKIDRAAFLEGENKNG